MILNIWYFARVKEALGREQESVDLSDQAISTVEDLIAFLAERGEPWRATLSDERLLVAVNQAVASRQTTLADGDEVAFFPPVSGG